MLDFKPAKTDLFRLDVEALVNPVNCRGVMGAGLALEFRDRFPVMMKEYERLCDSGEMKMGRVEIVPSGVEQPAWIVLFPTKDSWRENSQAAPIDRGLNDMVAKLQEKGIKSVGIPALGCGLGNLSWPIVRSIMVRNLSGDYGIKFFVTAPLDSTR